MCVFRAGRLMPGIKIENGSYVYQKCVNCNGYIAVGEDDCYVSRRAYCAATYFPFATAPSCFHARWDLRAIWTEDGPIHPGDPGWDEALVSYEPVIFR